MSGTQDSSRTSAGAKPRTRPDDYGSGASYWDSQYLKHPRPFEWLREFKELADFVEKVTGGNRASSILHVGCGNSMITESMYDAGYHQIVNIDVSSVVISQMAARNNGRPDMRWLQMDATCLEFADSSFDMVLDKSLIDTLACTPCAQRSETMQSFMEEVFRVLRPGGVYLCISFGTPSARQSHFELPCVADVSVHELAAKREGLTPHFVYICRKANNAFSAVEPPVCPGVSEPVSQSAFCLDELD